MPLSTSETIELASKSLLQNVSRQPLVLVKGRGTRVWDADGREYLDFVAGIATLAFGHCPPFAVSILERQARTLWHVSNLYHNEPLARLAELLTRASGLDRAFFCNSGAEANEAAIKMARKRSHDLHGPGRFKIVSALGSFHGRTMGAISATGQSALHKGFEPMLPGFEFATFGDFADLEAKIDESVCGVLLEPVQGEGGVVVPPQGYLPKVAALCRERGISLILDEIQCGLGRTGEAFAFMREGVEPDIVTLGKALGCGYPVGALLAREATASALTPGTHSTTVGGAPLAMALGLELASRILAPEFLAAVRDKGERLKAGLSALKDKYPSLVAEVRGLGLMLALVLTRPAAGVVAALAAKGLLVNVTAKTAIRMVPPLNVEAEEIDAALELIDQALAATLETP